MLTGFTTGGQGRKPTLKLGPRVPESTLITRFLCLTASAATANTTTSLVKSLERLLDSCLYWYGRLGSNYRPETDGKVMAKYSRLTTHTSADLANFFRDITMRQVFELLANLAWSAETLNSFCKVKLLAPFANLDAQSLAKTPRGHHLQRLWLRFITNLTFTHEGQSLLLATTGVVDVVVDHVKFCKGENQHLAFTCLQNLCGNPLFKTHLYKKSTGVVGILASALDPKPSDSPELYVQALTAVSNAAYNCSKFRVLLKSEGFVHRLTNLKAYCQETKSLTPLIPSVELLLQAMLQ
ncbi:unnamed protein product [Mesocestoides corti]|uniref:Armadillo repeat-containing protein 7 n=1 Tax=Mesocestoides corti TaxID=53468 RepID=A0A0R3U6N1_MESCO|nr:unnamed protein product [Mesocestoides corti]